IFFKTRREKYNYAIKEVSESYRRGQPVLVGTASVEASETFSRMLNIAKVPHKVLNAKHHEQEADIVTLAGQKGAVTIATNMAGRGTDIRLGEGVRDLSAPNATNLVESIASCAVAVLDKATPAALASSFPWKTI
ncbi:MAG: hypothetical protein EBS00_00730, partial [Verrucomicrobia bacterium]|nr:hypothetical protein [Verrucomicrobiota bacterium]